MNWGGFAGGLAQGIESGIRITDAIDKIQKQRKLEDIRTKGLEEAKGMQQAAAADLVKEVGVAAPAAPETVTPDTRNVLPERKVASVEVGAMPEIAAQTGVSPAKRFAVGDQTFNTRDDAMAAATKKAPSVMDFMSKTVFPRVQEELIAQGRIDEADRLQARLDSQYGKDAMKSYGTAMTKLMFSNDVNNGIKALGDYYNKYIDDGVDFVGGEQMPDGKFLVKTRNKADGTENSVTLSRGQILRLGMSHNPAELFKNELTQTQSAEKLAAETRAKISEETRQVEREIAKEGRAQQYEIAKEGRGEAIDTRKAARSQNYDLEKLGIQKQLEAAGATSKTKQEANAKVDFLRGAGYSEEFIRDAMPGILGIGDYKKRTAPEEVRRMLLQERLKDVYGFGKKTPEEQKAIIDNDVKLVMGGATSAASPAAGGLPAQGGKPSGVPVFDTKTGTIVYR